jgi:hypothetical protein
MYCTTEEANQKWCPFVRVSTGATITVSSRKQDTNCQGNRCMAWVDGHSKAGFKRTEIDGYCGLVVRE